MFPFIFYVISYSSVLPFSAQLIATNSSSLWGHPSAVFFTPSLIGEKTKLESSITSFIFLTSFKIYGFSFSYNKVAIGMQYVGTRDINEKYYVFGFSRKLRDVDFGLSILVNEKDFEGFASREILGTLALSRGVEDIIFGASFTKNTSTMKNSLNIFAILIESLGCTYIDYIFYQNERTFSLSQEFNVLPLLTLSIGYSKDPDQYFVGLYLKSYIKPAISLRYLQNLGYVITSGIEYTF
ncbi:MAG: hypothetical protein QMD82_06130 [bacterium]|nr:hypothetical protein [bacterium]